MRTAWMPRRSSSSRSSRAWSGGHAQGLHQPLRSPLQGFWHVCAFDPCWHGHRRHALEAEGDQCEDRSPHQVIHQHCHASAARPPHACAEEGWANGSHSAQCRAAGAAEVLGCRCDGGNQPGEWRGGWGGAEHSALHACLHTSLASSTSEGPTTSFPPTMASWLTSRGNAERIIGRCAGLCGDNPST